MGDPPQLSVKIPSRRDVPHKVHEFSEKVTLDFLLLTAVECEFLTCFYYLQEPLKYYDVRTGVVYVGKMGDKTEQEKLTIGLMQCGMGSGVRGSAMAVQNAVMTFSPKGVFCVGFCGGLNANKAKLGDVAVSAKLIMYGPCKFTKGGRQPRGEAVSLSKKVSDIMIHAGNGWNPPLVKMEETGPKVVLGTVLSGSKLVNFKMKRDELLKDYAEAIAIEMEGEGVYTAAHDLQVEWVVVKGISDYADGTKDSTTKWKPFASMMAASLVAHVLRQPSIFQGWPRYNGESSAQRSSAGPTKRRHDSQGLPDQNSAGPSNKRRKDSVKVGQVSEEDMNELANGLGDEWIKLGRRLKVNNPVLSDLRRNAQLYPELSEKAHEMLRIWECREGDPATYQVLYEALCHKHVARKDLAQKICCH